MSFLIALLHAACAGVEEEDTRCLEACTHVYGTCGIAKPGQTEEELIEDCTADCDAALAVPGEMGDYQPNLPYDSSMAAAIRNDAQAEAWMDCVWTRTADATSEQCADLDPRVGYCAPI